MNAHDGVDLSGRTPADVGREPRYRAGDRGRRRAGADPLPQIVADAAMSILACPARECTGSTFLDVEVLGADGVTDFAPYGGTQPLDYDIFVDHPT